VVEESPAQFRVVLCLALLEAEYLFRSLEGVEGLQNRADWSLEFWLVPAVWPQTLPLAANLHQK